MTWRAAVLWYVGVALVVCFFRLGSTAVIHNEGIIADGARHMKRTGDLLVPHLYNEPYTYKPPLTYWLVFGAFELTGRADTWTMRVPIALCGLLMGLAVLAGVGRACSPRLGLIGALATLTGGLGLERIRIAEYDAPLAAGVGVAVVAASWNLVSRPRAATWLICYLGLAFGFLAKGTPALLIFLPGLVVAAWLRGRPRELASLRHLAGLALFVSVVGLYLWLAGSAGHPAVFDQPLAEATSRGLEWSWRSLGTTAVKPVVAAAAFLPWGAFLPIAVLGLRRVTGDEPAVGLLRSGLGFAAGGMLALMAVPTLEVRYFYPLAVPVGIVGGLVAAGGVGLPAALRAAARRTALLVSWLLALATLIVGAGLLDGVDRLMLVGLATAAVAVLLARAALMGTAQVVIIGALCLWAAYALVLFPRRAEKRSFERAAMELVAHIPDTSWLWIPPRPGDWESALVFYLDRPAARLRQGQLAPLPGSLALLSPKQLRQRAPGPGLRWVEVTRVGKGPREVILGRLQLEACSLAPDVFERRAEDLHAGLIGRLPTPDERAGLASRLAAGTPLAEVGRELTGSREFRERRQRTSDEEIVGRVYRATLGREPDPGGLSATVEHLRRGRLHVRVADILTSAEYLAAHPYCKGPERAAPPPVPRSRPHHRFPTYQATCGLNPMKSDIGSG